MSDPEPTTDPAIARPGCEPARAALQRLLDREPNWDTREAVAHRAGCLDCREELALARSMSGALTPAAFPSELTGRVVGAAVSAHRKRRLAWYAGAGAAVAASVLVAALVLQPRTQTITETRTVAAVTRPAEPPAPQRPLGEAVSEARDALVALTRRTATETRDTSASLMPTPKLPDMPETGAGLEPLADARAGAARSVEPLQTSARRALNLFLRAADPPNKQAVQ
jgi:hypothetical protein